MSSGSDGQSTTPRSASEDDVTLQGRLLRYLGRFIRLCLMAALYALVLWYGAETAAELDTPPTMTWVAVALIALGIAGSTYRILIAAANAVKGDIMVFAAFLNEKLVEPQRRRLRAEGHAVGLAEGRAEGRAEIIADIRARLLEEGIDPERIFPLEGEAKGDAERC